MLPTVSVTFCLALLLYSRYPATEACGERWIQSNANVIQLSEYDEIIYNKTGRVIGGTVANAHSWPWMVLLNFKSNKDNQMYMCGATIISDGWLLTAAHCAEDMIVTSANAYVGIQSQQEVGRSNVYHIKMKILHPQYNVPLESLRNDIALLQLSTKLCFTQTVQPICLPLPANESALYQTGTYGYVAGWGQYTVNGIVQSSSSVQLRQAQLPFIDPVICRFVDCLAAFFHTNFNREKRNEFTFRQKWPTTNAQICAGAYMKGTGQGDSGGPLKVRGSDQRWYQVGITSYGSNEGNGLIDQEKYPGVYTRISQFCQFIQDKTNGEVVCGSRFVDVYIIIITALSLWLCSRNTTDYTCAASTCMLSTALLLLIVIAPVAISRSSSADY